jgi:hypothetical protein
MTIKTGDNEMKPSANGRWLHSPSARVTDNPQGALIAYMKLEYQRNPEGFPYLFPNIRAMRSYLQSAPACKEAIQAVPRVWLRYRNWLDQHPA